MKAQFYIREAKIDDIGKLTHLSEITFRETFEAFNTKENMDLYAKAEFSLEYTKEQLMDPYNLYHLAFYEGICCGYTKMCRSNNPKQIHDSSAIEISRIYVAKHYQGKNIGKQLLDNCIQHAALKKLELIWLGVWEKNTKAIEFYKYNGFNFFGTHEFILGHDRQNDFLMKKDLKNISQAS